METTNLKSTFYEKKDSLCIGDIRLSHDEQRRAAAIRNASCEAERRFYIEQPWGG